MLNSISWSDYLLAVGVLLTGYYVITVALLFSQEIKSFVKGSSLKEEKSTDVSQPPVNDVLGSTRSSMKSPVREDYLINESVKVNPVNTYKDFVELKNRNEQTDEDLLTGTVSDLLEEVKSKIKSLQGWKKDECLSAFRELLVKYPQLRETVYQESIGYFIANTCSEHFDWNLEPEEVNALWS